MVREPDKLLDLYRESLSKSIEDGSLARWWDSWECRIEPEVDRSELPKYRSTKPLYDEFGLQPSDITRADRDAMFLLRQLDTASTTWGWAAALAAVSMAVISASLFQTFSFGVLFLVLVLSGIVLIGVHARYWGGRCERLKADLKLKKIYLYRRHLEAWERWRDEQNREYWRRMRGEEFENALEAMLQRNGYRTTRTPGSGDGGVDIIAIRGGKTLAIQCKAHASPVGIAAARELVGAVAVLDEVTPVLASVSGFTGPVLTYAKQAGVLVWGISDILAMAAENTTIGTGRISKH